MSEPTLPDDLNPVVVAALAKLIGSITGLVPPPANAFPPEWHGALREFWRTAGEIVAANLASSPVVSEGFALVPIQPTQAMCQAGQYKAREWPHFPLRIAPIWQAMIAATPTGDGTK